MERATHNRGDFDFCDFFTGTTFVSGWFADRFGTVRRHFSGRFIGSFDGEDFVLDETLEYTDGLTEHRIWRITVDEHGKFVGRSESLIGEAKGTLKDNTLHLVYRMKIQIADNKFWDLSLDDWMFMQPDGTVHNSTRVKKWGITIGTVSTQYLKASTAIVAHRKVA